ncbi:hypothetical protein [Limosilactobacillus portuensis]|uniref:hypothetical protein n=1 Tax=Limosilactobacillus portuensis TaxID=2742601 RepID=UPI00235A2778|nr:hypothetical protein [Limosilactobacillus portuensis]WCT60204.1 hypothetical protein PRK60_06410 [Limosilactobacillus portuensis]
MEKGQTIYVAVYCTGCYSDYLEQVVGIADSKERALELAKQAADYVNSQEHWWFDDDSIVIRKYKWNEFLFNNSKACRSLSTLVDGEEVDVYKSGEGYSNKFKPVEDN